MGTGENEMTDSPWEDQGKLYGRDHVNKGFDQLGRWGRSWRKGSTYSINAGRGKPRRCQRFPATNYELRQFVQNGHTQPETALD